MRWFQSGKPVSKVKPAVPPEERPSDAPTPAQPKTPDGAGDAAALTPVVATEPIPESILHARAQATRFLADVYRTATHRAGASARFRIDPAEANRVGLSLVECVREPYWLKNGNFPPVLAQRDYPILHPVGTALLAVRIGKELRYEEEDLINLGVASLFQNIGQYLLPRDLFLKEGELTESERKQINEHPKTGYETLRRFGFEAKVFVTVLQHHERWDGSGYPDGRRRNDIFRFARVVAVADTYHALISARPWRPAMMAPEALEFVVGFGDELFELSLAQTILKVVPSYEVGTKVRLSTGEVGFVVDSNLGVQNRPLVRITTNAHGQALPGPFDLDLSASENLSKLVVEVLAGAVKEKWACEHENEGRCHRSIR
jgi:HD-GYP domain-containing protein (c-di-GMP phosphodiesterase class II)